MKLGVHQHPIVIYIYFKFHDIWFRGYLVIANYLDFNSIQELKLMIYQGQPDQTRSTSVPYIYNSAGFHWRTEYMLDIRKNSNTTCTALADTCMSVIRTILWGCLDSAAGKGARRCCRGREFDSRGGS